MSAQVRKMRRNTMQKHVRRHKISEAQELEVVAMYETVERAKPVAEAFGVSDETVRRILKRRNVPRTHRHENKKPKKEANPCGKKYCWASVEMLRRHTHMKFMEIAEFTETPRNSVNNIISKRCPDTIEHRDYSLIDLDEIEREYLEGATTYELGEKYRVNHATIGKWMRARGHHRGRGGARSLSESRICTDCGEEYTARSASAKRCDACRKRLNAPKPKRPRKTTPPKQIVTYLNVCTVCGDLFITPYETKRRCSEKCQEEHDRQARKRRRAIRRGAQQADGISWHDLMERDHGICQICGMPVDVNDLRWGVCGPLYPSQDHIVPLAKGGADTMENSQLAHVICNSVKCATDMSEEVARHAEEQAVAYQLPRLDRASVA